MKIKNIFRNNFLLLNRSRKNFTISQMKQVNKDKSLIENQLKTDLQYKPLYFYYHNIEHRAMLPTNFDESVKEFLEKFAEQRSDSKIKFSSKNFEMIKNGSYIDLNTKINSFNTKTYDKDPIIIVDDTLTLKNLRFRGINKLSDPYTYFNEDFQDWVSKLITNSNLDTSKLKEKNIQKILKSLDNYKGNKTMIIMALTSYLDIIKHASNNDKNLHLKTNFKLELENLNKVNKSGLNILYIGDFKIPINIVLTQNEQISESFNREIIDNLDTSKKLAAKYGTLNNFGIVTDFNYWKFTYYRKPKNNFIETVSNFQLSTKYDLFISPEYVNESTFFTLSRLINSYMTIDEEKIVVNEEENKIIYH